MRTKSRLQKLGLGAAILCTLCQAQAATQVLSITPAANALNQAAAASVVVQFDNMVDTTPASINAASFSVRGQLSGTHAGVFSFDMSDQQVTFTPNTPFFTGETVFVDVSSQIKDWLGVTVQPWVSQFTVQSATSGAEFARGVIVGNVGGTPLAVVAVDLNGDGKLDLVVGSGSTVNSISVLLGNGDGTFAAPVQYPTGGATGTMPFGVCVADVNGDGNADILVSNYSTDPSAVGSVSVLFGDGAGHLGSPTTYPIAGLGAVTIVAGDLDGDGYADIAVSEAPGPFEIFWNDGTGNFPTSVQISGGTRGEGLAIGDVNGDGLLDLVSGDDRGDINGGYCSVTLNLGNRTFATPVRYGAGLGCRTAALADLNGDGALDIVVGSWQADASFTALANQGNGTFGGRADYLVDSSLGPWGVSVADFDGDGRPDVVAANINGGSVYNSRSISLWHNASVGGGGVFDISKVFDTGDLYPAGIAFGDFTGSGKLDLVTTHYYGSVTFLKNSAVTVSGLVYLDENEDCVQSGPDEIGVGGQLVRLTDASGVSRIESTQPDGTFNSVLPAGNYSVSMVHNANSAETCNGGLGVTYNITVAEGVPVTGLNFGAKSKCSASVTCASQISWPCPPSPPSPVCTPGHPGHLRLLCPCEQFRYEVTVHNSGTALLAGSVVRLQLSPDVKFIGFPAFISSCAPVVGSLASAGMPDPNPPCDPLSGGANTGQLVQWTLGSPLPAGGSCVFYVDVQVANVPLGTIVCATPSLSAFCGGGPTPATVTSAGWCDQVKCSYDPNDKSVTPAGCGPLGHVAPGTPLTYRVQFQNLGNAPASRVLVSDLLDHALDPNTIQILSTSHTLSRFEILPGREMVWTFDNINLPAAASDEAGSRGEIVYSVLPLASAGDGTTILNTASIYFDQNPAVITATTINTIQSNPDADAAFTAQHSTTQGGTVYDFTYTGASGPGAVFAWDFGFGATPATSTDPNPTGIDFGTPGFAGVTLSVQKNGCTARTEQNLQTVFIPLTCLALQCVSNVVVQEGSTWDFIRPTFTTCCGTNATITILSTVTNGGSPISFTRTWSVTDDCGTSLDCSQTVTVVAAGAPIIVTQPQSQIVPVGSNVLFSVGVTGGTPLAYQWRFNGSNVPGGTDANYTIDNARTNDSGGYDVVATNAINSATSRVATLTVLATPNPVPLSIVNNPDGTVTLAWPSTRWTLQEACEVVGPWSNSPSQVSPVNIAPLAGKKFYRLSYP